MKTHTIWFAIAVAMASNLTMNDSVRANTTITDFHNFTSDALYGSWSSATIVSGPTSYQITASGYGSNWKYLPVSAIGNETNLELTVTLSGGGGGFLGPIVTLVDTSGREYNYAWYGRPLGSLVLTSPISSPTSTAGPAGPLDIAHLNGIHMQLDPSSYGGSYTISWQNLRLLGPPPSIRITSQSYDPGAQNFTLTWSSSPGQSYTVLYSSDLSVAMAPLAVNIPSGGSSTTTTVSLPNGNVGFLRIKLQ